MNYYNILLVTVSQFIAVQTLVNRNDHVEIHWIEQNLDHFNKSDTRTWKMRYMSNNKFHQPGGPIFLYIGAEWRIQKNSISSGHFHDMAKIYGAHLFYTEHRYYGESKPTENLSIQNLKYLNVKQALADLAHFIRYQKSTDFRFTESKVIMLGCSYAGTLGTWFKREYPDLVNGLWATGAPLFYKLDFPDYMINVALAIRTASGDPCYHRLEQVAYEFSRLNESAKEELWSLEYFELLDELDSQIAYVVQYHNGYKIRKFCNDFLAGNNSMLTLGRLLKSRNKMKRRNMDLRSDNFTNSISRQWLYQLCNEFGNFQTTSSVHQPFGHSSPLKHVAGECKEVFGPRYTLEFINDQIEYTNTLYGGYKPNIKNAYFSHGQLDPWRTAGVHYKDDATISPDTSHCGDMHSMSRTDNAGLRASKEKIKELVGKWLSEE